MLYYKLQMGCLIVVLYLAYVYWHECYRLKKKHKIGLFDIVLVMGIIYYLFDMASVYSVNHPDTVSPALNQFLHAGFLLCIDTNIFLVFLYMLSITDYFQNKNKSVMVLLFTPFVLNVIIVIVNIGSLTYYRGTETNYSMGISAYTCFIMVAVYILFSMIIFLRRWHYIEKPKKASIAVFLLALSLITGYQMFKPEVLLTSLGVTINIIGIYVNMENPARQELDYFHKEMVYGFANLIESRDGSTGEHVKRTTQYVLLIANEMKKKGYGKNIITKDYIQNLQQAAPLHDIGKIATPDAILQKPDKLTADEYEVIKQHTVNGEKIIRESMGNLGDEQYIDMASAVARYHHEKWDGSGYPEGLSAESIPLCARIMAVADVFDAVVEKRCYRDAMTLEQGFELIRKDVGKAFDPLIAEVFLDAKEKVIEIHKNFE